MLEQGVSSRCSCEFVKVPRFARNDIALESGERSVDPRQHFFFSENFEQVIQAGPYIATSRCESCRMNDCADLYAELCRGTF